MMPQKKMPDSLAVEFPGSLPDIHEARTAGQKSY
jgi:hypothetical protein